VPALQRIFQGRNNFPLAPIAFCYAKSDEDAGRTRRLSRGFFVAKRFSPAEAVCRYREARKTASRKKEKCLFHVSRSEKTRCSLGAGFAEDFSRLRDFLAAKPYVDTARREKSRRREKDLQSIFICSAHPENIVTGRIPQPAFPE
jgi:hypothetical protein